MFRQVFFYLSYCKKTMASLRLQTYNNNTDNNGEQQQEEEYEQLLVDFDADYSDIFPTPIHLQKFLQNFFDVMWKSLSCSDESETKRKGSIVRKMHKFSLIGGDDESLDVQFTLVVVAISSGGQEESTTTSEIKTAQAFFPDDAEIMAMHKEFAETTVGGGKRMNDGGEWVDDDEDEDYY